ncbi:hypothetical protein [Dietzia cinnamea]|uniref:hypothetical protein n=1 Tax=Dietzia cinnamea TaxID=321318 RepID=UPI00223AA2A2|nr:hypothetical protein [Dietzia cinnamea]MCT1863384.1 hypothetical protein [Dietzia cinnamea]
MTDTQKAGPHHGTGPHENAAARHSTSSQHRSAITDVLDGFDDAREAMGLPRLRGRGITLDASQIEPAGPAPSTPQLLLSALLWAGLGTVRAAREHLAVDDLDVWHEKAILAAVYACADAGTTGTQAVLAELFRTGRMAGQEGHMLGAALSTVATAGGQPGAIRGYVADVLAAAYRREAATFAIAVVESVDGVESAIWETVTRGGTRLRRVRERLAAARGGAGDADE